MQQHITIRGNVATAPRRVVTKKGLTITDFRMASTDRKRNHETDQWEDGDTSWFSVSSVAALAENAFRSLKVGDPVIVSGRVVVEDWVSKDKTKSGTSVKLIAQGIGHDLNMGFADFQRIRPSEARNLDDISTVTSLEPFSAGADDPLVNHGWQDEEFLATGS